MSIHFKNMKALIDNQSYYAESIEISESININYFSPLGTKSYGTIPSKPPEGTVNINFYLTTGTEIDVIESGYANTGFSQIQAGPFQLDKALLNSFSVDGSSNSVIKGSASYTYYGQMTSGSIPTKDSATIIPAHGASSSGNFGELGISGVLDFNYSYSQDFNVKYSLSSSGPNKVEFIGGSKQLTLNSVISDTDLEKSNLSGEGGICISNSGISGRQASVGLYNLCQDHVGDLTISGYITSRSISTNPGSEIVQNINVSQKYVKDAGCDE